MYKEKLEKRPAIIPLQLEYIYYFSFYISIYLILRRGYFIQDGSVFNQNTHLQDEIYHA